MQLGTRRNTVTPVRIVCVLLVSTLLTAAAYAAPVRLRSEYVQNPLGIDVATPHFSWQSDNSERNWRQTAYQILVASTADALTAGKPDIWDSGKINSSESVGIAYAGPKLQSRTRYFWNVRVWNASGHASMSSENAWWETGLLNKGDWKAKWIAWNNPQEEADRAGIRWIWVAGQDALAMTPKTVAAFHLDVDVSEKPREAALFLLSRGGVVATLNGHEIGAKRRWNEFDREDIAEQLAVGKNSIEVRVTVAEPDAFGPDAGAKTMKAA